VLVVMRQRRVVRTIALAGVDTADAERVLRTMEDHLTLLRSGRQEDERSG
jgi:hypothetical protein